MQTPEKADDPLAPILTRILELALTCAPRSAQQVALVQCYAHALIGGGEDTEPYVSPDEIRALAGEVRSLMPMAQTSDLRAIAVLVQELEHEAVAAVDRTEQAARFAATQARIKGAVRSSQAA